MLFLLIFSLAIAAITITDLPIVIFLLMIPGILFLLRKKYNKFSYIIFGACFLALVSRQVYQRRYISEMFPSSNESIQQNSTQSYYLSTGIISEHIWSWKYIYSDNTNTYLLYSSKSYIPDNKIRLVARKSFESINPPPITSISLDMIFYTGFNVQKRSKMKWYDNILYETNSVLLSTWTMSWFTKFRYNLIQRLLGTYSNSRTVWLVLGMLIWDKSQFSKSDYQLFIDSGLVHLVAVSGGNIVMLVAFLMLILFFVPFYVRIVIIIFAIIAYGIICGMDSSVLRAILMWLLSMVALLIGKWKSIRRLLAMVYIMMLIYNPYFLVYDVGFLLSFSAVLGILFLDIFKKEKEKNLVEKPLCHFRFMSQRLCFSMSWGGNLISKLRSNYLKPSVGATLGIFPVIIFFMGQINIGGIIWNIFVLPIVPLIMIGWFVISYLPLYLQKYWVYLVDLLVKRVYYVSWVIDQYGLYVVAEATWIKYVLFFFSTIMMIIVIWTLTQHEKRLTSEDKQNTLKNQNTTSSIDDIIHPLFVEVSKKS